MRQDMDHNTYLEWVYLDADGGLGPAERSRLQRHLLTCAECRREREALPALFDLLESERMAPDDAFVDRVMSSLPPTAWEARHPRGLIAASVALVLLVGGVSLLAALGSTQAPGAGPLMAVIDLFGSAVLAGAGLLGASWQGLGMVAGELLGGSATGIAVFTLFVLGIDFLFLRLLMRSWKLRTVAARAERGSDAS